MSKEEWTCDNLEINFTEGQKVQLNGSIIMDELGWSELRIELSGMIQLNQLSNSQDIYGIHDDMVVVITGATPSNTSYSPSRNSTIIKFSFISASFSLPDTPTIENQEILLNSVYVIGESTIDIAGTNVTISDISNPNDKRIGLISGLLTIHSDEDYSPYLFLISIAQRCIVHSPKQSAYSANKLVRLQLNPSSERHRVYHPIISTSAESIVKFLASTISRFNINQSDYCLRRLTHYYCLAFMSTTIEIKFILASVFMEAFKFYWALNVKKLPSITNSHGMIKDFEKSKNKHNKPVRYEFGDLLNEASKSIGITENYSFIDNRNAMFHSGAPVSHHLSESSAWLSIKPELTKLYTQMDNILLSILGYSGDVYRWESPSTPSSFT
jgi:hypothetical protein